DVDDVPVEVDLSHPSTDGHGWRRHIKPFTKVDRVVRTDRERPRGKRCFEGARARSRRPCRAGAGARDPQDVARRRYPVHGAPARVEIVDAPVPRGGEPRSASGTTPEFDADIRVFRDQPVGRDSTNAIIRRPEIKGAIDPYYQASGVAKD